jgi:hypothetical protein
MSTKKHKCKAVKHSKKKIISKNPSKHPSLISKYPRFFFCLGSSFVLIGIYLLIIGIHNNAKFGLAMLSIFVGLVTAIFANSALPGKAIKAINE